MVAILKDVRSRDLQGPPVAPPVHVGDHVNHVPCQMNHSLISSPTTKYALRTIICRRFFPINTKSLQIGRRFSTLNADEDLKIYAFFWMKKLNTAVTDSDMGTLFLSANSIAKRSASIVDQKCRNLVGM
ncbi:Uncharacterized protein Fot_25564 [Forsythia ovata]|uniref:Uncharacterized protein n=1 Tax=Forsythia ovata TaxID=205694 RepID=A0ABD1U9E0_9LAMI